MPAAELLRVETEFLDRRGPLIVVPAVRPQYPADIAKDRAYLADCFLPGRRKHVSPAARSLRLPQPGPIGHAVCRRKDPPSRFDVRARQLIGSDIRAPQDAQSECYTEMSHRGLRLTCPRFFFGLRSDFMAWASY